MQYTILHPSLKMVTKAQGAIPKSFEKEPDTEDNNEVRSFFTGKGDRDSTFSVVHSQDGRNG